MRLCSLSILALLCSCATAPYSLVPSPGVRPFGGVGESSCLYANNRVYYVADVARTDTELVVSLRVYNKSARTAVFREETLSLATLAENGSWTPLERLTNRYPSSAMTVDDQIAATWSAYNGLTQLKGVLPEPDFKAREKRIADRLADLEQKKSQGVTDRDRAPDIHPTEQYEMTTNFVLSAAKRLKVGFVDDAGKPVEMEYVRNSP